MTESFLDLANELSYSHLGYLSEINSAIRALRKDVDAAKRQVARSRAEIRALREAIDDSHDHQHADPGDYRIHDLRDRMSDEGGFDVDSFLQASSKRKELASDHFGDDWVAPPSMITPWRSSCVDVGQLSEQIMKLEIMLGREIKLRKSLSYEFSSSMEYVIQRIQLAELSCKLETLSSLNLSSSAQRAHREKLKLDFDTLVEKLREDAARANFRPCLLHGLPHSSTREELSACSPGKAPSSACSTPLTIRSWSKGGAFFRRETH